MLKLKDGLRFIDTKFKIVEAFIEKDRENPEKREERTLEEMKKAMNSVFEELNFTIETEKFSAQKDYQHYHLRCGVRRKACVIAILKRACALRL